MFVSFRLLVVESISPESAATEPRGVYDAAVVAPVSKALACGDVGIGALADVDDVAAAARTALGL